MEKATIFCDYGYNKHRVTLPSPQWEGEHEVSVGITLEALYKGPRSGRMFAKYYSCWDNETGEHVGMYYEELDEHSYSELYDAVTD